MARAVAGRSVRHRGQFLGGVPADGDLQSGVPGLQGRIGSWAGYGRRGSPGRLSVTGQRGERQTARTPEVASPHVEWGMSRPFLEQVAWSLLTVAVPTSFFPHPFHCGLSPFSSRTKLRWSTHGQILRPGRGGREPTGDVREGSTGKPVTGVQRDLLGTYFPPAVLGVQIPTADGGLRMLGITTVANRVAQQVVAVHLGQRLEPVFHPDFDGDRPRRSVLDAWGRRSGFYVEGC